MRPSEFVALPCPAALSLAPAAAGGADAAPAGSEASVPNPEPLEVEGEVCSRRVCGRLMFFQLRGVADPSSGGGEQRPDAGRVQVLFQCSESGEEIYQAARQTVTVGCRVTFSGLPGFSRRGDLSLIASNYTGLDRGDLPPPAAAAAGAAPAVPAVPKLQPPVVILWRDEHIIAVDKPPFIPVHASFSRGGNKKRKKTAGRGQAEAAEDTLLDRLAAQLGVPARPSKDDDTGYGLHPLHRLDKDTSGVVLFALDRQSGATLRSEWGRTIKRYATLVDGHVDEAVWLADAPLADLQQGQKPPKRKGKAKGGSDSRPQKQGYSAPAQARAQAPDGQIAAPSVCDPGRVLPCGSGFVTSALPGLTNRIRDRAMVESSLKLPEDGSVAAENLALLDLRGNILAKRYARVLYGDHGPYLEFTEEQLAEGRQITAWWTTTQVSAAPDSSKYSEGADDSTAAAGAAADPAAAAGGSAPALEAATFYTTHITSDGKGAKVYEQAKTVADKPNPPRTGTQWQWNNRPEGYADYRVGMFYVSCFQVVAEQDCEIAAAVSVTMDGEQQVRQRHRLRQNVSAAGTNSIGDEKQTTAAKPSRTSFLRLAETNTSSGDAPALTLLLAKLHTGRTHQIRRHLLLNGTPVVCDGHYGKAKSNKRYKGVYGLARMFLHAAYMRFPHPVTQEWITVRAPLPADLTSFLQRLPPMSADGGWKVEPAVGPTGWADGVVELAGLAVRHMERVSPEDEAGEQEGGGDGHELEEGGE